MYLFKVVYMCVCIYMYMYEMSMCITSTEVPGVTVMQII